jgi:DNA-binding response OmpR family regulator
VQEFWADQPGAEEVQRSGLRGQPLLGEAAQKFETNPAGSPDLTASEDRLLRYLQAHAGQVCEKDDLIQAVWPKERLVDGLRDDSLAQLIRRLRQKIEPDPANPVHILTVTGRGYRFTFENEKR